jgi:23S rRNA (cytosine1962-C5)-methyltransferase
MSVLDVTHLPVLRLKRNEDRRLQAGHLWVFSNEVDTQQTPLNKLKPGELVRVLAHNDRALGLAYANPASLITARLLETWAIPDARWFEARLRRALALRERLYSEPYYRAVYGEADGLPGLVIDRYGERCVAQIGTAGMELMKAHIRAATERVFECETLIFKNDGSAREMEGLPSYVEVAKGGLEDTGAVHTGAAQTSAVPGSAVPGSAVPGSGVPGSAVHTAVVVEGGLRFRVPLVEGQKTGWFFDQSANRQALRKYVRAGARVLDVFSYVGAWGARAAKDGAAEVVCVDSSASALELAAQNARQNSLSITTHKGDAFDVLEALCDARARFDIVIVDPPAFAKRKKDLPKALAAYKRLNQLALRLLADDGILVSCSCSYHVSAEDLQDAIAKAARGAGKHLQVLELGGQAPDHPVHPAIPETRYLKAYFCRVNESLK